MTPSTDHVNVLLIGGGGREHALGEAIARSPRLGTLHLTHPVNPGLAKIGTPVDVPVNIKEIYRLQQYCDKHAIGLVVIGPEDPLAEGYADALAKKSDGSPRAVLGPTKAAARLEADKAFAKKIMKDASVPTAEGRSFTDYERAREYLETRDDINVIKAAGLAKGKGVIVPKTAEEGLGALEAMMVGGRFGEAGKTVIIEEKLSGPEISVLALVDGRSLLVLPSCQDHKRLGEGDTGPNTGGMGAFCPSTTMTEGLGEEIEREILVPTIDAMRTAGAEFTGVLYAGIMLTPGGPKVLEFNVRFGDPECQPLMARLESDALELCLATAEGRLESFVEAGEPRFRGGASVCVVLASEGYPENPKTGVEITGVDDADAMEGVTVYHAGTKIVDGKLVTAGGRVLGVTAVGDDFGEARERAYTACLKINFPGKVMRADIGASALV
ncbi:MAG: phosphoribosylamine--glycine ligase [Planctomycetota bacterium]